MSDVGWRIWGMKSKVKIKKSKGKDEWKVLFLLFTFDL